MHPIPTYVLRAICPLCTYSKHTSDPRIPILFYKHSTFSKETFGSPQLCHGTFLWSCTQGIVICAYASFCTRERGSRGRAANNSLFPCHMTLEKCSWYCETLVCQSWILRTESCQGWLTEKQMMLLEVWGIETMTLLFENLLLFREDVTEVRFVLSVKFRFGKILTFIIRESTDSFPLYT